MTHVNLTRGERFKDARHALPPGRRSMRDVENVTGVSASMIKDLEDDDSSRDVGYSNIVKLARHYAVSIDWLLGLSDVKSPQCEIQGVCKYTGLSEQAVAQLLFSNASRGDRSMIIRACNMLLESNEAIIFLSQATCFSDVQAEKLAEAHSILNKPGDHTLVPRHFEHEEKFERYLLIEAFKNMIDHVFPPIDWDALCKTADADNT